MHVFFFFKQKTAYELRISDWSSDVCSSDLRDPPLPCARQAQGIARRNIPACAGLIFGPLIHAVAPHRGIFIEGRPSRLRMALRTVSNGRKEYADGKASVRQWSFRRRRGRGGGRSAEHTSELQSLMRT